MDYEQDWDSEMACGVEFHSVRELEDGAVKKIQYVDVAKGILRTSEASALFSVSHF
jgi:hypothetical protein